MSKGVSSFLTLWLIWVLLSGFAPNEIAVGAAVALTLTIILVKYLHLPINFVSPVKVIQFIVIYIPLFIYQLILSNFDLAYRVLSPSLPIKPGFVRIPTSLTSDIGKLVLANSITLTPGTLSLDVDGQSIYIHWVNVCGQNPVQNQQAVSGAFERVLGAIFK